MSFEEKTLVCVECSQEFVHSADDQARYAERGFSNEPKRCPECREKRRTRGRERRPGGSGGPGGPGGDRPPRETYDAVCAECGVSTTVPFKPTQGRPVYCRDCYRSKRP
ncbi:MAG: CxxC-x17-CxxC domain-containing protein [Planctomycetota bacterium]|jgi:CxxC-x17-CxxC domain-containing protein